MQGTSAHRREDWPVGPARKSALMVAGLSALGLVAAFANALPLIVQLPLAITVLALGGHALRGLLQPGVRALGIEGQSVRIQEASGARSSGTLVGVPFVSPVYVGLRWCANDRRLPRSLGIFREQMDAPDFRRLCAALRQREES